MRTALILLAFLVVQVGCKKTNDDNNNDLASVFPNKVGNTWTYLVNDTSYFLQNPPTITQYTITVSVIDTITLPGDIHAKVWVYHSPAGNDSNYEYQHLDTISFISKKWMNMEVIGRYIVPFTLNNSWLYSWNSVNNVTVMSRSAITVGTNHFENASHILGRTGRPDEILGLDEWVADHVGIVKRYVDGSGTNNPFKYRVLWSLISYHLE